MQAIWLALGVWVLAGFSALVFAYAWLGPGLFGKRPDGRLSWWAWPLLGPPILTLWGVWHIARLLSPRRDCHEIAPGIWLGRRPLAHELPEGVALVVDLVAELPAARGVSAGREYVALPTLDSTAPSLEGLRSLLDRLERHPGPIYVHCAQGRGRSALVVAALLLRRGLAASPEEAVRMLRAKRPRVRLNAWQMRRLREIHAAIS